MAAVGGLRRVYAATVEGPRNPGPRPVAARSNGSARGFAPTSRFTEKKAEPEMTVPFPMPRDRRQPLVLTGTIDFTAPDEVRQSVVRRLTALSEGARA